MLRVRVLGVGIGPTPRLLRAQRQSHRSARSCPDSFRCIAGAIVLIESRRPRNGTLRPQGQSQPRLRGAEGRGDAGERADLARDLHALRSRLLRRRDLQARTDPESVWTESVTHPPGIYCYLCAQNGHEGCGSSGWIRTSNPPVNRLMQVVFPGGSSWVYLILSRRCSLVFGNKLFTDCSLSPSMLLVWIRGSDGLRNTPVTLADRRQSRRNSSRSGFARPRACRRPACVRRLLRQ